MDERTIIERSLRGDARAYGLLVEKYQARVFALVCKVCRDRDQARELAQDVFLKAYRMLGSFRGNAAFSTWLYRIAYTTAISGVRKNISLQKAQNAYAQQVLHTPAEEYDPTREALYRALQQALDRLDTEDRLLIELYYYKELKMEEVAYVCGMSVSNAKVRIYRIRQKLMAEMPAKMECV